MKRAALELLNTKEYVATMHSVSSASITFLLSECLQFHIHFQLFLMLHRITSRIDWMMLSFNLSITFPKWLFFSLFKLTTRNLIVPKVMWSFGNDVHYFRGIGSKNVCQFEINWWGTSFISITCPTKDNS